MQAYPFEFEASLVCKISSSIARAKQNKTTKNIFLSWIYKIHVLRYSSDLLILQVKIDI